MTDFIYDIEVLPNVFTLIAYNVDNTKYTTFEISPRRNDMTRFVKWMNLLAINKARMVGFNNVHYDYPVIHHMMNHLSGITSAKRLTQGVYQKSKAIFRDSKFNKFAHTVWDNKCIVEQIDLFKIHHFDNVARMTSLKRLQFNMRLPNVQEFEIPFDEPVKNSRTIDHLLQYNKHDVISTYQFYLYSQTNIKFREDMSAKQGISYMNYNDTKIGESYLLSQIKEQVGEHVLYTTDDEGKRKKRTTKRSVMLLKDIIFDDIKFETPEFKKVLNKMLGLKMFSIKGKFHWNEHGEYPNVYEDIKFLKKDLKLAKGNQLETDLINNQIANHVQKYADHKITCELDGVEFVFGKGGLHATLNDTVCYTTDDKLILDLDVTSYYPSIGIENGLYPEHLTSAFCPIYAAQKTQRLQYAKGTTENGMLKLALNGSYGKTNSEYSPLCDPLYTVTTTVNGQLLLCVLWEGLRKIPGTRLIQVNTDGVTIQIDKTAAAKRAVKAVCKKWEKDTKLQLESAVYSRMWIRDGNNYIAEYTNGKLKSKGAYVYRSLFHSQDCTDVEWHKNHSMLIVQKAVEAELIHGIPVAKFIIEHEDVYDFFLSTNVPRTCKLMVGDGYIPAEKYKGKLVAKAELGFLNKEIQRVTRYLISNSSDKLTKVMPPLRNDVDDRYIGINVKYNVSVYNKVESDKASDYDINYQFYIDEAEKLLKPFRGETL